MKKIISALLTLAAVAALNIPALASDYSAGAYYQLGKYNDTPIIWRCVGEDENGILMVSDKILCYKAFDAGYGKKPNEYDGYNELLHEQQIRIRFGSEIGKIPL